jgi:hypothetical protein
MFSILCAVLINLGIKGNWTFAITLGKFIGLVAAVAHHCYMYSNSFYYFRNAGLSIRRLYAYSVLIDFILYLVFIIAFILLSHAAAHLKS